MIGRTFLEWKFGADQAPPYEMVRLQFCERMGWTFAQYDDTPARDILEAIELWRLQKVYEGDGGMNG